MLKLTVVLNELYDEENNKFIADETIEIELEHSLASLSKWEEIWLIPLITTEDKTAEQNFSYFQCMCLTPNVAPEVFYKLTQEQVDQIADYLNHKATATWFSNENPQAKSGEAITAELIYYWMSSFHIDWEAQHWHLNKLLTLIKVFSAKQDNMPKRTRSRTRQADMIRENARRRAELGSTG